MTAAEKKALRAHTGRMSVPPLLLTAGLAILLVLSVIVSLAFGSERLPLGDVFGAVRARVFGGATPSFVIDSIVWELRLPRALLAAIAGAGLAIAGAAMQTLVRNPLADPYLLGVASGAGLGATVQALRDLERPESVAARRGLPLDEVAPSAMLRAQAAGRAEAAEKKKAEQAEKAGA